MAICPVHLGIQEKKELEKRRRAVALDHLPSERLIIEQPNAWSSYSGIRCIHYKITLFYVHKYQILEITLQNQIPSNQKSFCTYLRSFHSTFAV